MLTTSLRRVGVASVLLYAAIVLSLIIAGRPLPGSTVAQAATGPTTAQWQCAGTKFFFSAGVGASFTTNSVRLGGTFSVENNNTIEVRNNPEAGFMGYIVAEFNQPKVNGDTATITFNRQIQIVSVYNWDNDPDTTDGETGWSFQGTALPMGSQQAFVTPWNELTNTVTWSAGNDSGGIDFCFIEVNGAGGEGCTPGYWKQPHHFDSWVGFTTGQDYETVFGVDASFTTTLLGALQQGGGGEKALGRHAVAALLNSASGGVDFEFSTAEVIALVQQAYLTGDFEGVKNMLEDENERGCPLN
jgi:hypothetical protein